jgi:photosystem II stability/assembly factor-like uncharacterized protein
MGTSAACTMVFSSQRRAYWLLGVALILLSLTLTLPAVTFAYSGGWAKQTSGTTSPLWGVDFVDATHGWAVGGDGTILGTTDGGLTWSPQATGVSFAPLDAVTFADPSHGCAVGISGATMITTNGGATWVEQVVPTAAGATLFDVTFSDASHGWAAGSEGTILATADGGLTWNAQTSGTDEWLWGVDFVDSSHGWAVGTGGTILRTTNGGATWSGSSSLNDHEAWLNAVAFRDASHGWAVGMYGMILATVDGGATWKAQNSGGSRALTGVACTDSRHVWVTAADNNSNYVGAILATGDGGATWMEQTSSDVGLHAVACGDASHVWAVGYDGTILAATVTPTPTVTLKLGGLRSGATTLGKSVTAKGVAAPAGLTGSKTKLTVQRKNGAKWVKVTSSARTIGASGAYSWKYKPAKRGAYRMQAKVGTLTVATSPWRTFKVK